MTIGVIVLNWNGHRDTLECLESLTRADPRPKAVNVVDNASSDDSLARIEAWARDRGVSYRMVQVQGENAPDPGNHLPWLTILACDANRGFAGGNNVALRYLQRCPTIDHFMLLNNDAVVAQDFFAHINAALNRFPNAGLVTGTIYEAAPPNRVWYAGGRFLPTRALVAHDLTVPACDDPIETNFVSGCVMLISRQVLKTVGLLEECYYPVYVEDAEYSYRVHEAGLAVVYAPSAVAYHKVGSTINRRCTSAFVAFCLNRHRLFFVRRNLRGTRKLAAFLYMAITKPGRALVETLSGRPRTGWATLRGTLAGFFSPYYPPRV